MKKSYKLSDEVISGDKLSENIYKGRKSLLDNIKSFSGAKANDGSYAENIITTAFGGGNLNHLNRNYAHFDVAIVDGIEGIVEDDEIISVKCTHSYKSIANILKNTEAIKLNSVFSYMLGAISDFTFINDRTNFSSKNLIEIGIEICKKYKDVDFEKVINSTLYYLIFKNTKSELDNYKSDINKILSYEYNLTYGTYTEYELDVKKEVDNLDSPISIGTAHIDQNSSDEITCVINKTKSIPLSTYWYDLTKIWSDKKYYLKPLKSQYLTYEDISRLFKLDKYGFPIQITISTGSYVGNREIIDETEEDRVKNIKDINRGKILKLKTASRLNDTDFGKYNNEIVKTFNQMIDDLVENPSKILKYQEFIKK